MRNGATVAAFERELAAYCGAKYAIAASNGTVTLQAALVALGVQPGDRVAVPPLTMSATTIAVLNTLLLWKLSEVNAAPMCPRNVCAASSMTRGPFHGWWSP